MPQPKAKIGVIGGSGLYDIEGMTAVKEVNIDTPFGKPSDTIVTGKLGGVGIAFLPRPGKGHRILPAEVPSRANIYALKSLGVEHIIAVCSAGSFKKEIEPGHLLIPDQLIDRTRSRPSTFFGEGIVAHVPFADPFCPELSEVLYDSATAVGATVHPKGTFVVMEGPAFSTRAESRLYRSWGADLIGMTALPEAKLAREAEICYAIIGCVTDYDSWWQPGKPVTVDMILDTMHRNIDTAKAIIKLAVSRIPAKRNCPCPTALETAIVTSPDRIPQAQKEKLDLIIGKYIK
ncbi:MAG: methylthioadenosine phosphorylase [Chloroflexi bacterium RBG_16_50_9]|nr:MAG: methylthioadenosine phosphorylase [Chloroflexi bacterium RBG_16_50_9]